jgi:hypothetical protein
MSRSKSPLNNIKIASPCSADWNTMYGSERKRFCGECKLNVYNLSAMSIQDAEELLLRSEGRLCVRYYRRADGTILTEDCPVGWAGIKRRLSRAATAVAAMLFAALGGISMTTAFNSKDEVGRIIPIPLTTPTPKLEPLMGAVMPTEALGEASPTPQATPTTKPIRPKAWRVVTLSPIQTEKKAA